MLSRAVVEVNAVVAGVKARGFIGSAARFQLRQGVGKGRKKA
ncbi:hypothetical protein ULF88_13990 [Halopseudomonas pachastrellae]|nr:hypothetical protein [Halopseudomonas pachastrellae]